MIILGTNSIKDTGFNVANSLRFNSGSSDYLSKTFSSAGNRKKWTWSCWFKKSSTPASWTALMEAGVSDSQYFTIGIDGSERLILASQDEGSGGVMNLWSSQLIRDLSAWYHFVVVYDSAQSTASNRVKGYINGNQITSFNTANYPDQNKDSYVNSNVAHNIGKRIGSTYYDGYMSEFCFLDGTALGADSFGEFDSDSGIWKPIDVSGLTFGTNGFYLDFENSGALGNDAAGSNNFTVNNLTAIDQSTDTCTNNFSTMNPLSSVNSANFTEGNLKINLATNDDTAFSSIAVSKGKWYWEEKRSTQGGRGYTGVCSFDVPEMGGNAGRDASSDFAYTDQNGVMQVSSGATSNSNTKGSALSNADIICYAFDIDNGQLWTSVNQNINISGTANATGLTTGKDYFYFFEDSGSGSTTIEVNFGSPTFSISSGNTDGNGYGNFEFAVPSGYFALCTKNLSEYG